MGKLRYARELCGEDAAVFDLAKMKDINMNDVKKMVVGKMFDARIIVNLQDGIRAMLEQGVDARAFFEKNLDRLEGKVLICDEIGSGIVPMDPFERRWRDETGFVCQLLARRADVVDRVWAGLPVRLKAPATQETEGIKDT
ncbi:MAG: bifunctional adenosylcobinamide kinase/adenosylcobinamide-phosphate guanylyltransferase [Synergistaceae bacterium]|nr:bifunctional adenosylcobinamide kinase/adenosylcobinamide-phosphate guanylyltransferase [Synergistaceae bacterium]